MAEDSTRQGNLGCHIWSGSLTHKKESCRNVIEVVKSVF